MSFNAWRGNRCRLRAAVHSDRKQGSIASWSGLRPFQQQRSRRQAAGGRTDDGTAGCLLGDRDDERAEVVAGGLVVLHVLAITPREGAALPASAVHCLVSRRERVLPVHQGTTTGVTGPGVLRRAPCGASRRVTRIRVNVLMHTGTPRRADASRPQRNSLIHTPGSQPWASPARPWC